MLMYEIRVVYDLIRADARDWHLLTCDVSGWLLRLFLQGILRESKR